MNIKTERRALFYRVLEFAVCQQLLEFSGELSEAIKVVHNIKDDEGNFLISVQFNSGLATRDQLNK